MSASRMALTLIVTTLPWFVPTTAAQDAGRFRGMDTNRDGIITRDEWRGNAQSFREHDWNNDGVLSGDEVLPRRWARDQWEGEDFDPQAAEITDWTARAFNRLDRNGDGRVTRTEWPYDVQTFRQVDRNNNSVITRAEYVGANVSEARNDQFEFLDHDNNNRVGRDEWHGTRAEFNRLDRNRDGVLTRRELNQTASDVARAGIDTREVRVDPRERWTATGLYVQAGDLVTWQADGTITMSDMSDTATPAGSTKGRRASNAPLREALAGGLLMNIGGSVVRFAGPTGSVRATTSGELYFGVNDDHLPDNNGEYRVRVTIGR